MGILSQLPDPIIHFSSCIGTPLFTSEGQRLGKMVDFFVDYQEQYPTVLGILYKQNKQHFYVEWSDLKKFNYKQIIVLDEANLRKGRTFPRLSNKKSERSLLHNQYGQDILDYPPIGKVILDKQVVDTFGKKVVRVNDINFIKVGKNLRVTHAGVGMASMMRRLGFDHGIMAFNKVLGVKNNPILKETLISWRFVHAIADRSVGKAVALNVSNEDLKSLHPADLADILEELDNHGRSALFENLDPQLAAETLSEMEHDVQKNIVKDFAPAEAAELLEKMGTDEAADVLSELPQQQAKEIIENIKDDEFQEEIQELLSYEEDEAGGLMSTEVFALSSEMTKTDVLEYIAKNHEEVENIYDIYIIDEQESLLGTCSLQTLLTNTENITLKDVMEAEDIKALSPTTHWKEVAEFMSKYNLMNVPIIDNSNILLGVVSVDDILPWLLDD